MDLGKCDSGLVEALESDPDQTEQSLAVFVHLVAEPTAEQFRILAQVGAAPVRKGRRSARVVLSPRGVDLLSDQPWVRALTLSAPMHPLSVAAS